MKREALLALLALGMVPVLRAQDTTRAQRPVVSDTTKRMTAAAPTGTPLEQLVFEESQRRANIARVLLITNSQVALQQEALRNLSDQLYVSEQLVGATHGQLTLAAEALRKQPSTMLSVLFAADSIAASRVTGLSLSIDGANTVMMAISDTTRTAFRVGAADELFRGAVLPTPHTIVLTATVNGQPQQLVTRVSALGDAVTYVQFAIQEGKLVQTSWASRTTNPF
ncbi:MAG TPA: hypothetical protein VJO33_13990 [Gemmatimonadaceae bacterium]|nr:hypothetical protein [Gemmatimonadaceae bacterium]